ncbi:MAG: hypothetical protein D6681_06300 [Calditrichaeota bacterium]|nr:MAG: hypothetical protein D6681_06300 [Calditrichota bacterium]
MKKHVRLLAAGCLAGGMLLTLLILSAPVQAKSSFPSDRLEAVSPSIIVSAVNELQLTARGVYSVFLPIIFGPPAPSTKKGFMEFGSPACNDLTALRAAWYQNASPFPDPACGSEYHQYFVPRIYNKEMMIYLSQAVTNAQASGWLIGFGEPNLTEQNSYLTPTEGAQLWKQIEDAVAGTNVKLVSPAPNQWNPGQYGQQYGHQWTWYMVDEFQRLYGRKPRFDALGWHYYATSLADLQAFLTARRSEALARGYDVPFWLLEYGGSCVGGSVPQLQTFMAQATPWLNETPWIGRYTWFAARIMPSSDTAGHDYTPCSLIDYQTGNITALGQTYWWY